MIQNLLIISILTIYLEARRAITFTYAVAYFVDFSDVEKDMFEMQQSMLWEALDNLDKFTDEIQIPEKMREVLIDEVQGSKNKNMGILNRINISSKIFLNSNYFYIDIFNSSL